jgi:hypothetical protein
MASIPTAAFKLTAQGSQAINELRKTKGELDSVDKATVKLRSALGSLGVALSAAAVTTFVRSAAAAADELGKSADRIGVATERLRAFRLAAEEAGVATSLMDKALLEAQLRLGQAAAGTGEARKFIELLKLDTQELVNLRPDELFLRYADAIGSLAAESDQLAAANALFGESGRQAIELIRQGRPVIDEAQEAVDRLGLALNRIDTKQIERANDALGRVQASAGAAGQQFAAALAPFVQAVADSLLESGGAADGLREKLDKLVAVSFFAFQTLRNGAKSLEAAFFGLAAGGARVLQALTFGNLSESFGASSEANVQLAQAALNEVRSFQQISDQYVAILENNRAKAEAAVAAQQAATAARQAAGATLGAGAGAAGFGGFSELQLAALESERAWLLERRMMWQEADLQFGEDRLAAVTRQYDQQIAVAVAAENAILEQKQAAAGAALGLLQALAGRSKAAAIAAIVLNKGLMIAQAVQNTAAAATRALAELGPIAGPPMAAKIWAFGKLQIGLIAATGIAQAAGVGSGGAALGSPANPVFTQDQDGAGPAGASGQNVLQVVFAGPVFDTNQTRQFIVDALKSEIDRDVIVINPRSAQAQALGAGA